MSQANPQILVGTLRVPSDYSDYQYHLMQSTTAGYLLLAGDNTLNIGILQDDPDTAGMAGTISVLGSTSKVVLGDTVTVAQELESDASGHAVPQNGTNSNVCAIALEAGVSGDVIEVLQVNYWKP